MWLGLPNETALPHPCDTALALLLSPVSTGNVLYLIEQSQSAATAGRADTAAEAIVNHVDALTPYGQPHRAETGCRTVAMHEEARLPFPDAAFQLIVIALATWPLSRQGQRRLLTEVRRVLVASGQLLVMAQNRYGYARLRAMLRRRPMHSVSHGKNGSLLGAHAIKHLLSGGGFNCAEWFRPVRDPQNRLVRVSPLRAGNRRWRIAGIPSLKQRIKGSQWLTNEFVIRAAPDKLKPSALDHCLKAAADQILKDAPVKQIEIERLLVTAKEKVVVMASLNGRAVVMRIPLSRYALNGCQRNMAALRSLALTNPDGAPAPSPLADGYFGAHYYAVESRIAGQALRDIPDPSGHLASIELLIKALHPQPIVHQFDEQLFTRVVSPAFAKVAALISLPSQREALERFFRTRLRARHIAVGMTHGDFSLRNICIVNNTVSGVIDWDESCPAGLPVLDVISHLCSRQFKRGGNFAAIIGGLAAKEWPEARELTFLDRCYAHLHSDPSDHCALVFLYWLVTVSAHLDFWYARDSAFLQTRIHEVVEIIMRKTVCE